MQLRLFIQLGSAALAVTLMAACEAEPIPVVPLDIPTLDTCLEHYHSAELSALFEAYERGDTFAARCRIRINLRRGEFQAEAFEYRYLIYRLEGIEPEGLDAVVRSYNRQDLATKIASFHYFHASLEPIERHWLTLCYQFDDPARELLLRAPMGEDTHCLPRGQR